MKIIVIPAWWTENLAELDRRSAYWASCVHSMIPVINTPISPRPSRRHGQSPDSFTATPCALSVLTCTSFASSASFTLSLWQTAFFPLWASLWISSGERLPRCLRMSAPASVTPGRLAAFFAGWAASSLPL